MRLKRIIPVLISPLLILFLIPNPIFADQATITSDNLNIRNGPGTNFDIIGQANTDVTYQVIGEQDEWVQIKLEEESGWVTKEYIAIEKESSNANSDHPTSALDESSNTNEQKTITIQFDNTQLRNGPSTEHDIIYFADKGTKYEVISEKDNWYKIASSDFTGYVFKQLVNKDKTAPSAGIKNKTIVIDAGHGGRDVGAIGATGVFEKKIAYLTARELEQELTILGANVILTRSEDEFISLGSRTSFSNINDTDAFISIHYNSVPELPNVTGVETYYYHKQNKDLATYIQREAIKETNANDRGTTFGNFFVIRQNFKPSVLIELGFISNEEKEALLGTTAYQQKIVLGIVNGLRKYFK